MQPPQADFGPIAVGLGPGTLPGHASLERLALGHVRALGAAGHAVTWVTPGEGEGPAGVHRELRAGVPVLQLQAPEGAGDGQRFALWRQAVAGARVLHLYPCEKGTGGLVQALAPELPVVLSLMHLPEHDLGLWQREIDAAARILVPGRTLLVRLADRLRLDPARVRIVEPGLPYGSELTSRSARTWAGVGPLRILHLGERGPDSGFEDLLAAIAMLEKDQVQLCCFGQPGRGAAPALRPAALQVTLGDRLDTQAIATLARSCHLAAFPMRRELGYTLVAEEALALGLPVLASHCDGVVERHGSGAIEVLPAGDVPAWARALRHHLSDPADLALAQAALPGTIADAAGVATRLHALYGEILATRAA